MEHTLELLW